MTEEEKDELAQKLHEVALEHVDERVSNRTISAEDYQNVLFRMKAIARESGTHATVV